MPAAISTLAVTKESTVTGRIGLRNFKPQNSPLQCEAHAHNLSWQGGAIYFCNHTCIYCH